MAERAREEQARHWQYAQQVIGELECLVERRLPQVVQELEGVQVPASAGLVHPEVFEASEVAGYLTAAEELVRKAGDVVRRLVEESARGALRTIAEEVQAGLTRAQADIDDGLDDLELTGTSSGVNGAGDLRSILTKVDHGVTMGVHGVQRLRILTDSWPGVQRASCTVAEIVESARGRIRHGAAVDYAYHVDTGEIVVDGLIVEPAIVALTELLANATAYSGGTVSVYVQRVPTGIRFSVEDQGLGMAPLQLEEAERALDAGGARLTDLAEPGRLGFLVLGRLMSEYGLRAGLSPSAAGGVRADLLVPDAHLEWAEAGHPVGYPAERASRVPVSPGPWVPMPALTAAPAGPGPFPGGGPESLNGSLLNGSSAGGTGFDGAGTRRPPGALPQAGTAPETRTSPGMPGVGTTPFEWAVPGRPAGPTAFTGPGTVPSAPSHRTDPRTGQEPGTAPVASTDTGAGTGMGPAPAGLPHLPKRQPRARRRPPAPSERAVLPDPETFTADLGRVMDTLAEGYGNGTPDQGA